MQRTRAMVSKQSVGKLRWMDYARRSMQRLGFLKWLLNFASTSHAQTLESLTRAFCAAITARVPIDVGRSDVFHEYVRQQHLHRRYEQGAASAEIQDILLSDSSLPSHTGAITGELERKGYRHSVYVEIPTWAARLRLLRDRNYTLTDRGRVLQLAGTVPPEKPIEHGKNNSLYLNLAERYVFLFCLLDIDGDLLVPMYKRLIELRTFTRSDAGEIAAAALQELRNTRLRNAGVGPMQQLRTKLDRTIEAAKKQSTGGLGPRESIATPRTEPLVDCGILVKTNPEKYEYSFTAWGKSFVTALVTAQSIDDFLDSHMSRAMSSLTGQSLANAPQLRDIEQPYTQLKAGIGYVSLQELGLLTVARALSSQGGALFEIKTVEETLRNLATQSDRQVRFASGGMGGKQVRIDPKIFKTG
jgi:hypothetical protein